MKITHRASLLVLALGIMVSLTAEAGSAADWLIKNFGSVDFDHTAYMRESAKVLGKVNAPPLWQQKNSTYPDVAEMHRLSSGHLLVRFNELAKLGYTDIRTSVPGPYTLVDPKTGRFLWQYQTHDPVETSADDPELNYSAITTPGMVLILKAGREDVLYTALAVSSGKNLWEIAVPRDHGVSYDIASNRLYLAGAGTIWAFDGRNGRQFWRLDKAFGKSRPILVPFASGLYLVGNDVRLLSSKGKLLWSKQIKGRSPIGVEPFVLGKNLIVPSDQGRIFALKENKKIAWDIKLPGTPTLVTYTGRRILVATQKSNKSQVLSVMNANTGAIQWSRPLPGPELRSVPTIEGDVLVFTVPRSVAVWSLATGKVLAQLKLPASVKDNRLPDEIRIWGDRASIATVSGVGSLSWSPSRWQWFHEVSDVNKFYVYSPNQLSSETSTAQGEQSATASPIIIPSFSSPAQAASARARIESAHSIRMREANRVLSSPASTRSQRRAARADKMASIDSSSSQLRRQMSREQMEAQTAMLAASASFLIAAGEAAAAIRKDKASAYELAFKRTEATRNEVNRQLHGLMVQGRWYLRPFQFSDGRGVFLVDQSSGYWREIVVSPDEGFLGDSFLNVPLAMISANDRFLVTHGMGLKTARWKQDDRFVHELTFHRSLLGYDLQKTKLHPPGTYSSRNFRTLSGVN